MDFTRPDSPDWAPLLAAAWAARDNAYAPYSGFRVGAALLRRDGAVVAGCNNENASYPLSLCAERTAIGAAVASCMKPGDLVALVVVTEAEKLTPPCGACRQVILELGGAGLPVILGNLAGCVSQTTAGELLPGAFSAADIAMAA